MRYIEGEISNRNTAMNMRTVMKLLWIWSVIVAAGFTLAAGQYASYGINQKRYPTPDGKGMICGDIDIRNEVRFFRQLENCTVIEGSLQILLIEGASQEQYQQLEFPDLVEITDYFLLYRVYGLKTLRHIFPNLSVIRGQNLFFNFALVAYEMMDLDELGLVGLASIERGAVRLEKNPLLCYVDTVDWTRIASGIAVSSDHFFKENRNPKECVKLCPPSCKETTIDNKKSRRCWTGEDCQRILTCDQQRCESGMCDKGICCDKNCLGGCTGPTGRDCVACKNVINVSNNQTICAKQCLPGTYEYRKRRCLHEDECIKTKNKLVKWNDPSKPGSCTAICPPGYQESSKDNRTCVQCENNRCPKSCPSKRVENVKTAQDLKECTIIDGHLEIRVKRGSNIGQELEANLGQIQEVKGHLWIHSSDALLSLNFFKSLRVIHGKDLANKRFALLINENVNLQELFREEVTNNLTIMNGNMIFHYNRKLCLHKIKDFENRVNMTSNKSDNDISETTNGDHMPCKVSQLNLTVVRVSARIAFLRWQNFKLPDARHLFGYVINYKEAPYKNVSIYDGRDACSDDIWSTRDVLNKSDKEEEYVSNLIVSLKPWTQYAVYIQTYTTSSAEYGAKSQIEYFKTAPAYPTVPVNLRVRAITNGSLYVSWDEPTHPNGNVTYYSVYWRRRPLVAEKLYERNYCHEPLFAQGEDNEIKKEERQKVQEKEKVKKNVTEEEGLCACPKTKEQQQEEETERMMQIEFENYLHNFVYIKRDRKTSGKKDLPGYQNFLRKLFRGRSPKGSLPNKDIRDSLNKQPKLNSKKAKSLFKKRIGNSSLSDSGKVRHKRRSRNNPPAERYRRESQTQYNTTGSNTISLDKDNVTEDGNNGTDKEGPYFTVIVENRRNILITNLGHFEDYNIEVIACQERDHRDPHKEKLCSSRAITMARTLPDKTADDIDPNSITIKEMKNKTGEVVVSWDVPKKPNGLIVTYEIKYNKVLKNVQPTSLCITNLEFNKSLAHRIVKLEPGNYSLQIRATSLAGRGNFTVPKYFTVTDRSEGPPLWPNETIIAVVVSAVLLLVLMVVIAGWFLARSRFSKVPEYATHISANPEYMQHGEVYQPDEWEVERDKIKLIRELGQGSFGMVYEGLANNLFEDSKEIKVAVKTVNEHASFSERMNFLNEASIMKAFKCNHVVRLLGVVSEGQPAYVVMELMDNGDLKNFLRMHRPDEEDMESTFAGIKSSKVQRQPPSLKQIIKMAGEIADGMAYLADKKFVHRDLAARNCMVADDLTVKIGDFGMTRDIYETDYYRKGGKALLPVRWMAPESLKDGIFTSLSDVWSYGVVLWEMATLAAQPYQGLSNEEVLKYVSNGKTMDKPDGCPDRLFTLMHQCWNYRPKHRPTFKEIIEMLVPQLDVSFKEKSYFFSDENKDNTEMCDDYDDELQDESNVPFISNSEICGAASGGGGSPETLNFMEDHDIGDEFRSFHPPHPIYNNDEQPSGEQFCTTNHHPLSNHFVNDDFLHGYKLDKSKFAAEACDCVMVEETNHKDHNHRYSSNSNSAIGSVVGSSDGSKESSKSSDSSYAQMNGIHIANGHVPLHHMRSTKC